MSIFHDLTKVSFRDFLTAIKQNPNLFFITIRYNVQYTTLTELKKEEQVSMDEHNSLHRQSVLNLC